MPVSRAFLDYVGELFAPLGMISTKRMFGGIGVYSDDLMFAFVVDDAVYLRVDADSEAAFRDVGSEPFTFTMRGREVAISYWRAPDEALEGPDEAEPWGRLALGAALRKQASKGKKRKARG